jgi:hypothetical protein
LRRSDRHASSPVALARLHHSPEERQEFRRTVLW